MPGGEDMVLGVEEEDAEDFVRQVGAADDQIAAGLVGAQPLGVKLPSKFRGAHRRGDPNA